MKEYSPILPITQNIPNKRANRKRILIHSLILFLTFILPLEFKNLDESTAKDLSPKARIIARRKRIMANLCYRGEHLLHYCIDNQGRYAKNDV